MSDEIAHLPAWVRRRDGSQVPFEADRLCQSLYAAAESLGMTSAFVIRELTDVVLHFLAKDPFDAIPTTAQIAAEVEKIVREVGQPSLALRYAEMQKTDAVEELPGSRIAIDGTQRLERFLHTSMEAYALQAIYSRDISAAAHEGLVHLGGLQAPEALSSLVLETARLAELPWWVALDDWRLAGGERWIVESPEWLCTPQMHPALTPHLCERLLSLPMLGQRSVELHLNIAEPPSWSPAHQTSPLFSSSSDDEGSSPERWNFLDGLLERWKSLQAPRTPAIAWHLHERTFRDDTERRQLQGLIRLALQGRAVRFIFDRPRQPIALAEGLDRKSPGVLLEVGLDLVALAERPDVANDGVMFLKKLPSLARIAVSAAAQKRAYLRKLPPSSPLKRRFLIERAAGVIVPCGLDAVVRTITGASLAQSPLSLDFAVQIVRTLKDTLQQAGRAINLDLRLDSPSQDRDDRSADEPIAMRQQLETAGKLHACAGAGNAILCISADANVDALMDLLAWTWQTSAVVRLQLERPGKTIEQGQLLSEPEA